MAIVITSLGSKGPWLKTNGQTGPEWTDTIELMVEGAAGPAAALYAAATDTTWGYSKPHPYANLAGIVVQAQTNARDGGPDANGAARYVVSSDYARPTPMSNGSTNANPLNRPPLYFWRFGFVQVPTDTDNADNRIVNSAGDPFDPPQTVDKVVVYLSVVKYAASFDPAAAKNLIGRVNAASITLAGLGSCASRTLRCLLYAPQGGYYAGSTVPIPINYEFEYRDWSFDKMILDKGYSAWYSNYTMGSGSVTGVKGKLIYKGNPTQALAQPALLDGKGVPIQQALYGIRDPQFQGWLELPSTTTPTAPAQLPSTVTPVQIPATGTAAAWQLPYRLLDETDFSIFGSGTGNLGL